MSTHSFDTDNIPRRFCTVETERHDVWARVVRFFGLKPLMRREFLEIDPNDSPILYANATHEEVIIHGKDPFIFIDKDKF